MKMLTKFFRDFHQSSDIAVLELNFHEIKKIDSPAFHKTCCPSQHNGNLPQVAEKREFQS